MAGQWCLTVRGLITVLRIRVFGLGAPCSTRSPSYTSGMLVGHQNSKPTAIIDGYPFSISLVVLMMPTVSVVGEDFAFPSGWREGRVTVALLLE